MFHAKHKACWGRDSGSRGQSAVFLDKLIGFLFGSHIKHLSCCLFHQPPDGSEQIVHHLQMAVLNIRHHTGVNVVGQKLPGKGVQGRLDSRNLRENIRAVGLFFHHASDAPHLSFNAVKTPQQGVVFRSISVLVAALAALRLL